MEAEAEHESQDRHRRRDCLGWPRSLWVNSHADRAASDTDANSRCDSSADDRPDGYAHPNAYRGPVRCVRDRDVLKRTGDVGSEALSKGKHIGQSHVAQPDGWRLLWCWTSDHARYLSHDVGRGRGLWECDQRFPARYLGVVRADRL